MTRPTSTAVRPPTADDRALWRNRDYLRLWTAQAVSLVGTGVSQTALPQSEHKTPDNARCLM